MGISAATLNGNKVTDAQLWIPAWGASYHDVSIDGEITLTGAVALTVADLTIKCTVLSGGPAAAGQGRSFYRLVAGAGGWGKTIPAKSYSDDAGVKLTTVLIDAAQLVGETFFAGTIDPTVRLGPNFTRPADQACRLLEQLSPSNWYVGEDGLTRLGQRQPSALSATATATSQLDMARGTVTLATDTIGDVLPGLVAFGLTVVDVEHEISAGSGLRSKLWGQQGSSTSRALAGLRAIVEQLDPDRQFRGVFEYRVVTISDNRLNLQPVRVSTGLPSLQRITMRPGVAGCNSTPSLGCRVIVSFVDCNPFRPVVTSYVDPDDGNFLAQNIAIQQGTKGAARVNDSVLAGYVVLTSAGIAAPLGFFPGSPAGLIAATAAAAALIPPGTVYTLQGAITSGSTTVQIG